MYIIGTKYGSLTLARQDQSRVMRGSDDTSVRVCVRPVLFRVLGTWCPATPATSVVGELLLVFLFCVLTTRDDALLASLSSRIVLVSKCMFFFAV